MDNAYNRFTEIQTYISIIVPVYNVEKYLSRCVDSILNQTFKNFELILVDDGSPDNCGKICDEYAKKDDRVRVIHKPNGGLADARNAGIELALKNSDSEWITFIDSDDWVHHQYLEFLFKAVIENNTLISIGKYLSTHTEIKSDENIVYTSEILDTEEFQINKFTYSLISVVKLIKKELMADVRFPVGKLHEDAFTIWKLLLKVDSISFVDLELYYYFQNPNSIMHVQWTPRRLDEIKAYEERIKFYEENKKYNLRNRAEKALFNVLVSQINSILSMNYKKNEKKYLKILRKKLHSNLRKNKKVLNLTVRNDAWIYECAYPKRMWIYWFFKAQSDKIKRKGDNNYVN